MIDIVELLKLYELLHLNKSDASGKIKLVRHTSSKFINIDYLIRDGYFELYQSCQGNPVFDKCDYIVSFIGRENKKALFYGVYQITGKCRARDRSFPLLPDEYKVLTPDPDTYYYDMVKVPGFEEYEKRVIIDWGAGAITWVQWICPKEIVQVLPKGFVKVFPGHENFILRYDELVDIIKHKEANRDWYVALSEVAGVYLILITDEKSGKHHYVGSATGEEGIWGRWCDYAADPAGGDKELIKLLGDDKDQAIEYANKYFRFTILRTLSKAITSKIVIKEYENLYMEKLGSRVWGLN